MRQSLGERGARLTLILIFLGVILSRLPLLWSGYGVDPDAWRVAGVARTLWESRTYEVSRFPGYPLHEMLTAPLVIAGGSFLCNGATMAATIVMLWVWWSLVTEHARHPVLLLISLAFLPLLWINSATTMDYVWSLLFLLLSLRSALGGNVLLAGVWLGIAGGFRPSNVVGLIPVCIALILHKNSLRSVFAFCATTLIVMVIAFLPVLATYGLDGWVDGILNQSAVTSMSLLRRLLAFGYRSVYSIGPLSVLAAAGFLLLHRRAFMMKLRSMDPLFLTSVTGVSVFLALFFAAPFDRSYLLPALPFLLLILDSLLSRLQLIVVGISLVSFAVLNPDVTTHESAEAVPAFNPREGIVVEEYRKRVMNLEERRVAPTLSLGVRALAITGIGEQFWFENDLVAKDTTAFWRGFGDVVTHSVLNRDLHFISLMNRDEIGRARDAGFTLYCFKLRRLYIESVLGMPVRQAAVKIIDIHSGHVRE